MQEYQKRVVDEKTELDGRINRLESFIQSKNFNTVDANEQERLHFQIPIMRRYSAILDERIAAFKD